MQNSFAYRVKLSCPSLTDLPEDYGRSYPQNLVFLVFILSTEQCTKFRQWDIPSGVTVCDSTMLGTLSVPYVEDIREACGNIHNVGRHIVYFVRDITTMMVWRRM